MRIAAPITLSEAEHTRFINLLHSGKTPVRLLEPIKIILFAHEGRDNQTIADELKISKNKVGRWRNRFAEGGFKALERTSLEVKTMPVKVALVNCVCVIKLFG